MKRAVVGLFTIAVCACASSTTSDPADGAIHNGTSSTPSEITLSVGGSVNVTNANLHISFDSLAGDSRCPSNVQCVWAGSAIVKLTTSMINGVKSVHPALLSTEPGKDTVTAYNQLIKLLRVDPARVTTDPVALSSYRVVLKVGGDK